MAHSIVSQRKNLKDQFVTVLNEHDAEINLETSSLAINNVYDEMVRKLCNTRIQEFLSSQKQKIASDKGHASTIGQNLHDTLLTQHANIQSRIKIE